MDVNKLTLVFNNLIDNITKLKQEDINRIDISIKVNTIIRNFKFDKEIKSKLIEGKSINFVPLLSPKSKFITNRLGIDIFLLLKSINDDTRVLELVLNELFNIINYKKTTINILVDNDFQYLKKLFNETHKQYVDAFLLTSDIVYNSSNIVYKAISDIIPTGINYKVVYVKPTCKYGRGNVKSTPVRLFGLPTLIGQDGRPVNTTVWDAVYRANKKFNTNLLVKCLVPYNTIIINAKAYNHNIIKRDIVKYYSDNIKKISEDYDRYSVILNSVIVTIMNRTKTF